MKGYTTREVAEVLGLPSSRILAWTRSGLITPRRGERGAFFFSFQDLVLLRTAKELLDADVSSRKVREALEALREQLPVGRPLSAVTISAIGDRVLVQDEESLWEPNSGQLQIDFAVSELVESLEPVARRALRERDGQEQMTADDWYDTALDLEAVATDEAITAYGRALLLDPMHSDAHLNRARPLLAGAQRRAADAHYREAADADPESARAFFNLGVALEDQDLRPGAVEAYQAALRLDKGLAVAHFNLSRLFERDGQKAEALSHLADYKRLLERGGIGA